jgi:hypothetical protein
MRRFLGESENVSANPTLQYKTWRNSMTRTKLHITAAIRSSLPSVVAVLGLRHITFAPCVLRTLVGRARNVV